MRRPDGLADPHMYITPFRLYDVRMGRWNTRDPIFDPSASPYEGMGSNPISLTDVLGLNPGGGESASGRSSGSSQSTGKEINVYADRIVDSPKPAESAAPETDVATNRMWGALTFAGGVAELTVAAFAVYVSGGSSRRQSLALLHMGLITLLPAVCKSGRGSSSAH